MRDLSELTESDFLAIEFLNKARQVEIHIAIRIVATSDPVRLALLNKRAVEWQIRRMRGSQ